MAVMAMLFGVKGKETTVSSFAMISYGAARFTVFLIVKIHLPFFGFSSTEGKQAAFRKTILDMEGKYMKEVILWLFLIPMK